MAPGGGGGGGGGGRRVGEGRGGAVDNRLVGTVPLQSSRYT